MSLILTCKTASGKTQVVDLSDFYESGEMAAELYQSSLDMGELFYPDTFVLGDPENEHIHSAQGMGFEQVWAIHELYEEHGEAFALFLGMDTHDAGDPDSWESDFSEHYVGEAATTAEFAEEWFRELNHDAAKVMDDAGLNGCIDWDTYWESMARFDFDDVPGTGTTYFFRQG